MVFIMAQAMSGQVGLRLKVNRSNFSEWQSAVQSSFGADKKLFSTGYEAGVDYWFRLKKKRIEFLPEVSFAAARTKYDVPSLDRLDYTSVNFYFHTQIYALDLEGDCNCPTFSKQGPSINKGLFFHFTPGISYYNAKAEQSAERPEFVDKASGIAIRAGIGAGIDIGISDLLTVTPIVSYYFSSAQKWDKLNALSGTAGVVYLDSSVNPSQLQFTLRFGFRPDYTNGRRRR